MTNQEWMCNLTAKEFLDQMLWLLKDYGKSWTDSEPAIIEWLEDKYGVKLKVGDEFTIDNWEYSIVCTGESRRYYFGFDIEEGTPCKISKDDGSIYRTGRYFPAIAEILKSAKGEDYGKDDR